MYLFISKISYFAFSSLSVAITILFNGYVPCCSTNCNENTACVTAGIDIFVGVTSPSIHVTVLHLRQIANVMCGGNFYPLGDIGKKGKKVKV